MKIAIIEDDSLQATQLDNFLKKYAQEKNLLIHTIVFPHAVAFLENYTPDIDVVFMDIDLPYLNGMDAAKSLRKIDRHVTLIFITNLTQYAIKGYEVEALDYIVKPVNYHDFSLKMSRAIQKLPLSKPDELLITTTTGIVKLSPEDIRYIEVIDHQVIYHTHEKNYKVSTTLKAVEKKLESYHFFRCNHCYLVNLFYVETIKGYTVIVDGIELRISQPRKKEFLNCLKSYVRSNAK